MTADVPIGVTILTAVGMGSIAAAIITFYGNKWLQTRQQTNEMARQKIDTISKSQPKFIQLASYYYHLSSLFLQRPHDVNRIFYTLCKIFSMRNIIFEQYGALQLDNLEAEGIVFEFGEHIALAFTFLESNRMQALVQKYPNYDDFLDHLSSNMNLYNRIQAILSRQLTVSFLERNCRWYSQLVVLELNHIYKNWYGDEPDVMQFLSADLQTYLADKYENYFNRIKNFELKKIF